MKSENDPGVALLKRMLARDEGAWREFAVRYDRLIYRCITKVTGRFSSFVTQWDINEIHAILLLQLLANDMHKLRSFDPSRDNLFGSWIGLLSINAAYDYLRSMRREPNRAPIAEAECLPCDFASPSDEAEHKERAALVVRAMSTMSEKDRTFASLYYAEGLEPEEIASRLSISVKTVYSKKHKIEGRLERLLAEAA